MKKEVWIPLASGFFLLGVAVPNQICRDTMRRFGIAVRECPSGDLRQTVDLRARGLRRGAEGEVVLDATAHYTTADADSVQHAMIPSFVDRALLLIKPDGSREPLAVEWFRDGSSTRAKLALAATLPDGDYKLHADYQTTLGSGEVELALPLYTPATIHVLTDRPLYEPGNVVQFRALALRARDLAPLDGRPGRWMVKDPSGEVVLEEKAPVGEWGVVAGTFPLDKAAPTGVWKVAWSSGNASDEIPFTVQPFTLPRFRIESHTDQAFYRSGDKPTIKGAVIYSSNAPVAGAKLAVQWQFAGNWPPPTAWTEHLLPKDAVTSSNGRFELALPVIPDDLQGKVAITARITATDPAGDVVAGDASLLLSKDGIDASAVTELGDGLVQSTNNRLYVRVTTPDGRVVAKSKVRIKRTWQPSDNGVDAELDEDGVASVQIDPGAPVNIVIPALPYRPAPRKAHVTRGDIGDLIGNQGASLADQVEIDRWLAPLAVCGKFVTADDAIANVGVRVAASGAVMAAGGNGTALDQCALTVIRNRRLPAGNERLFTIAFTFEDPQLPVLTPEIEFAVGHAPDELTKHVAEIAAAARDCLPRSDGPLPSLLSWRATKGTKLVELGEWARDPNRPDDAVAAAMPCVESRVAAARRVELAEPLATDLLGVVRFTLASGSDGEGAEARPQPTIMLGYELDIVADGVPGKPSTKLRIAPGTIPDLRMRVSPVVIKPGEPVTAQLIRGPNYKAKLPQEIRVDCLRWRQERIKLDNGKATIAIDKSVEGWCTISGAERQAYVYVQPQAELAVTVAAGKQQYRPGERANLAVRTTIGGRGGKAAVGLFGVDESLGQLVALAGPDELARIRPRVQSTKAFGVLDGQALALGRIRGANAAAAVVHRISAVPAPPELDAEIYDSATSRFDPVEELTDHFYIVLAELHAQARTWESKAPAGELMTPAKMAELWQRALAACRARNQPTTDAYGRELRLRLLPPDLLALVDPRAVIVVGTRLPEDTENWEQWVAEEKP